LVVVPKRDLSLDAFRGLTVMLMVVVNIQGNGDDAFAVLKHAQWNGLTLADLVFPWFLFIVGMSTALAVGHARPPAWMKIARRSLMLFFLGVVLAWLIRPVEFGQIRWMGVLQRIGIVYCVCAMIAMAAPGWKIAAGLALAILIGHSWLILAVPAPGHTIVGMGPGEGLSGWLDRYWLPGRLLRKTWDPEGVLSTLPAIASALLGLSVFRWRTGKGGNSAGISTALAMLLLVAGIVLSMWLPVNKALWTASFVLVTAGLGMAIWLLIRQFWSSIETHAIARLCVLYGQTALTLYVIHMLLLAVFVRKMPDGARIWDMLYDIFPQSTLTPQISSLLFALVAAGLCTLPLATLRNRGWLIKA
jgi:predicted acyltransferase